MALRKMLKRLKKERRRRRRRSGVMPCHAQAAPWAGKKVKWCPPPPRGTIPMNSSLEPDPDNVHWGYFDAALAPRLAIDSGERVTISTVSGGPS